MFDEIKNYQSTQYYKNYSNESQFLNNEGLAYSIYPDKEPWDGLHRSENVAEGVYLYVLEMEYGQITGTVTILR